MDSVTRCPARSVKEEHNCGNCQWHQIAEPTTNEWECTNEDSDDCGYITPYKHWCEDFEERM